MNKEIKLEKRKPTFNYILNDLAFESLKLKVIHGIASNQDKFDFDYQLKLKDKEIEQLNNIINELEKYMIKEQARIVINNTDEDEFVYTDLLIKLKELKESDNNE